MTVTATVPNRQHRRATKRKHTDHIQENISAEHARAAYDVVLSANEFDIDSYAKRHNLSFDQIKALANLCRELKSFRDSIYDTHTHLRDSGHQPRVVVLTDICLTKTYNARHGR